MESSDEKRPFWKRFRIPTWLMLIWSALMWIWILSRERLREECQGQAYSEACEAGFTIGAGSTFMGLWFMTHNPVHHLVHDKTEDMNSNQ